MFKGFKNVLDRFTEKEAEQGDAPRPGLKAPVAGYGKKGYYSSKFYIDIKGERDYNKNSRIKRVKPLSDKEKSK